MTFFVKHVKWIKYFRKKFYNSKWATYADLSFAGVLKHFCRKLTKELAFLSKIFFQKEAKKYPERTFILKDVWKGSNPVKNSLEVQNEHIGKFIVFQVF